MSIRLKYNQELQETTFYLSNNINFKPDVDDLYTFKLIDIQSNEEFIFSITDSSIYPEKFNIFYLSTIQTNDEVIILEPGWYKYEIINNILIESGRCYIYVNDEDVENQPETTIYTNDKSKYVYKR